MGTQEEHIQILYEIAMSIGAKLDLNDMLRKSLSTFLKKLNCAAGEVYFLDQEAGPTPKIERAFSIPRHTKRNTACQIVHQEIATLQTHEQYQAYCQQMPRQDGTKNNEYLYLYELKGVGFLVLVKNGTPLDPYLVKSLLPLVNKFASTCASGIRGQAFERSRQMLQTVLSTVGEGILTIDATSRIVMVNQEVQNIWGYNEDELLGRNLEFLMPEKFRAAHKEGIARYLKTGVASVLGKRLELEGQRRDGSYFPLEIHITETSLDQEIFFTAAVRDITERHELEKMRENFVSTVSHELRTPLASIMGFLETVLDGRPGPLTPIQTRFLHNSYKSSERLLKLIEELLTISRIQQGRLKLNKNPILPQTVWVAIQDMISSLATNKGVTIEVDNSWDATDRLFADQGSLEQVLINLVSNAIKFTPTDGLITIITKRDGDTWSVEVKDSGLGIPEDDIPNLFQRFYRARNATEEQIQGTGLGLYVCKAIVEAHDGEISIESKLGVGTTASFRIPMT